MVIQRWQSVLLFIAAVMMAIFSFLTIAQFQTPLQTLNFSCIGFSVEGTPTDGATGGYVFYTWPLLILSVLSFLLPLITIFLYKRPQFQRTLCLVEILFILFVAVLTVWYGCFLFPDIQDSSWSALVCAPVIAFAATFWARRRIGKDIALLRSADRFRD